MAAKIKKERHAELAETSLLLPRPVNQPEVEML
jgi:hypothetical protein